MGPDLLGRVPEPGEEWDLAEEAGEAGQAPARVKARVGVFGSVKEEALAKASRSKNKEFGKEVRDMPWGDRTGPLGYGPMSGRAAGYCAGYPMPGYANPVPGGGFGMGFGRGRGFGGGRGRWARWRGQPMYFDEAGSWGGAFRPFSPKTERAVIEEQLEFLQDQIKRVQERLEQLTEPESANP